MAKKLTAVLRAALSLVVSCSTVFPLTIYIIAGNFSIPFPALVAIVFAGSYLVTWLALSSVFGWGRSC